MLEDRAMHIQRRAHEHEHLVHALSIPSSAALLQNTMPDPTKHYVETFPLMPELPPTCRPWDGARLSRAGQWPPGGG
jgi:hypothetical protein